MARPAMHPLLGLVRDDSNKFYIVRLNPKTVTFDVIAKGSGENEVLGFVKDNGYTVFRSSDVFPKWALKALSYSDFIFIRVYYYSYHEVSTLHRAKA